MFVTLITLYLTGLIRLMDDLTCKLSQTSIGAKIILLGVNVVKPHNPGRGGKSAVA